MIELLRDRRGPGCEALTEYPHQFVRSSQGRYVHRPRSAAKYKHHTSVAMWCGISFGTRGVIGFDRVADFGEHAELCGTCEGRFLGSLDNTGLIFTPSMQVDQWRPGTKWCPGPDRGLYVHVGPGNVHECLLCGAVGAERGRHGWNSWGSQMTRHRYASERPKVFCPTCGIRDLWLDGSVVRCRSFRCEFEWRVPRRRRKSGLLPPSPGEASVPLPPPRGFVGFDQGPEDLFDDLIPNP
jgi:hypothetical protein